MGRELDINSAIKSEIESQDKVSKDILWSPTDDFRFKLTVPRTVYPPREDTELLAQYLIKIGKVENKNMVEIGCGSGAVSILAAKLGWNVIACDINPFAVAATIGNAKTNNISQIEVNEGGPGPESEDNKNSKKWYGAGNADLIVWNLPYLSDEQMECGALGPLEDAAMIDFSNSTEEGLSQNLRNVLTKYSIILKPEGIVLLLHSNNKRGCELQRMWRYNGWSTRTISTCNFEENEELTLFATWRPWSNRDISYFEEISSTNAYALTENLKHGTLIVAKHQTNGIGRSGNTWDEICDGFKGTWSLDAYNENPGIMQCKAAISVIDSISIISDNEIPSQTKLIPNSFHDRGINIKWPNDILYRTSKIAGILIQSITKGTETKVAIGIGVNCGEIIEDDERKYDASSLFQITGNTINPIVYSKILDACISSLFEEKMFIPKYENNALLDLCFRLMKTSIENGTMVLSEGILANVIGLDKSGRLIVQKVKGPDVKPTIISDLDSFTYDFNP